MSAEAKEIVAAVLLTLGAIGVWWFNWAMWRG